MTQEPRMVVISEELAQNLLGLCSAFPTPGGKQKVAVGAIQCALEEAMKAAKEEMSVVEVHRMEDEPPPPIKPLKPDLPRPSRKRNI